MKSILIVLSLVYTLSAVWAESVVLEEHEFKELHDESCLACHLVTHDKEFYNRDDRKMKTQTNLVAQVSRCIGAFNVDWFPDEEQGVVDYLNQTYYHFKPAKLSE